MELSKITDWEARGRKAMWRVKGLANECGVSARSLQRFWKKEKKVRLAKWLEDERFAYACMLLRFTNASIEEVSKLVAYMRIGSFSHAFRVRYGRAPSDWRRAFGGFAPDDKSRSATAPQVSLVNYSRDETTRPGGRVAFGPSLV
jgi:transcriptional regulator GlxA family with amidase domain